MRPNGVTSTYSFDIGGRLSGLSHGGDEVEGFFQTLGYNPLGQVLERNQASAPYIWTGQPSTTANYTHDALNRDAAVAAASGYDANGNLISDGVRSFGYDVENRLVSVSGGSAPLRTYIHGGGTDDPLVWLEGNAANPQPRWCHKDRLGSVIGVSSARGVLTPYAYGPYGEPQDWPVVVRRLRGARFAAYDQLMFASSHGSFSSQHIRNHFQFERL